MSTKCTIEYKKDAQHDLPDFHLYNDCFDDENLYLEMDCKFDANNKGVTVVIPWKLWNVLVSVGKFKKVKREDAFGEMNEVLERDTQ